MAADERGKGLDRLTDEELLRRVANVEAAPFAVLFDRHGAVAYSLARHMLGPSGAEDAVQEAFLNLWRTAARYDGAQGSVRTWLLALVRNRSIDALRRHSAAERRRITLETLEPRLDSQPSLSTEVIADLSQRERSTQVRAALASLPALQRRVLELAYFGGWSQVEIAEYLNVPVGTVKGRTRLGLTKLRDALGAVPPSG